LRFPYWISEVSELQETQACDTRNTSYAFRRTGSAEAERVLWQESKGLEAIEPGREFLFQDAISAQSRECNPPRLHPGQVPVSPRTRIAMNAAQFKH
jgi:hypothetical protein